jgi:hypothetical protein
MQMGNTVSNSYVRYTSDRHMTNMSGQLTHVLTHATPANQICM